MMTTDNQKYPVTPTLADDIHSFISKRDMNGIISVLNKIRSKSEYDNLCNIFRKRYNDSMYNKIWKMVKPKDYERINLVIRRAAC